MTYKRNKDGYYRETFVVPGKTPGGKSKRVVIRDKDLSAFKKKVQETKRLYQMGIALDDMTVSEWADRWLAVYKVKASQQQKNHYIAKLTNDILPKIGSMQIRDVRASHLQELLNTYTGGKKNTILKIRVVLKQLFDAAEIDGVIERNPAARLELPDTEETVRRPIKPIERAVIFEVAKTHKNGIIFLVMLCCGLRRGECLALKVGNVDISRRRISVEHAIAYLANKGFEKSPKSDAGLREVPIPDILVPFIIKACAGRPKDAVLFPKANGMYATQQTYRWWWQSFSRQCHRLAGAQTYRNEILTETSPFGADVTPHYLRHTYATDIYAAGVDDKAQKSFMGHSSSDVTDRYRKMGDAAFNRAHILINTYFSTLCWFPSDEQRTTDSFKYCIACDQESCYNYSSM